MKRELSKFVALVAMAFALGATAAETDLPWKFDETARPSFIVAPVSVTETVMEAWACPSWVEAYCEGGIFSHGMLLLIK